MEQIINLIKNTKSAVILPHISADGDAIGSCQAMRCALNDMGIPAQIIAEEKVDERLAFLSEGITVYNEEIPEFDTCFIIDCGDITRVGTRSAIADKAETIINIDHHRTNTGFGTASLVMPDAAAAGEILFDLFKEMDITFTREIAGYLYAAICSDTGRFAYSSVSPHTFRIAADLIGYNISHHEISRMLFDCADIQEELLKAELTKNIHSFSDGKIRTVVISREFADGFNLTPKDIDGVVEVPRRIRGTEIAIAIKELDDKIRISLRSIGAADVSKVALKFNGGGHIKAAGCSIEGVSVEEAEKMIVLACEQELEV